MGEKSRVENIGGAPESGSRGRLQKKSHKLHAFPQLIFFSIKPPGEKSSVRKSPEDFGFLITMLISKRNIPLLLSHPGL